MKIKDLLFFAICCMGIYAFLCGLMGGAANLFIAILAIVIVLAIILKKKSREKIMALKRDLLFRLFFCAGLIYISCALWHSCFSGTFYLHTAIIGIIMTIAITMVLIKIILSFPISASDEFSKKCLKTKKEK